MPNAKPKDAKQMRENENEELLGVLRSLCVAVTNAKCSKQKLQRQPKREDDRRGERERE